MEFIVTSGHDGESCDGCKYRKERYPYNFYHIYDVECTLFNRVIEEQIHGGKSHNRRLPECLESEQ
jgi:hypothetical protein